MKIAVFTSAGQTGMGVVVGDRIHVAEMGPQAGGALERLITGGEEALAVLRHIAEDPSAPSVPLASAQLLAPLPNARQTLFCVGKNYRAHAAEFFSSGFDSTAKEQVPAHPVIFPKTGSCVSAPGAPIRASLDPTGSVDYEGELAVVIGREAHKVAASEAYDVVFGYTICNDVTSRELQRRHNQWLIGKSLDSFGPLGPWIVTADELGDITQQELVTTVNGEVRQKAVVRDLIFDIPTLIETLSATMTLQPGDVIATGTPAGVGIGFDPPRYLAPGDKVSVSISGIGVLENPVV
jgi:2-keto-4-pentenoate hydratase/2-oxohepta-3-ene-1,7-dioic acid hydratase in catechol pathway